MGDGQRGRLISTQDRKVAVKLISEAVEVGARLYKLANGLEYIQERILVGRKMVIRISEQRVNVLSQRISCPRKNNN